MSLIEIFERITAGMTKEEAAAILAGQIDELAGMGVDREDARRRTLVNIGYFAGYYSNEIQDLAYSLFDTQHPIFGRTHPTSEEALRLGMEYGERMKQRAQGGENSITCPICKMTSYHREDIRYGYCSNCHAFTTETKPGRPVI
jgi:hypothetical protein